MEIRLAKTAGFCFGVNRAVELTYNLLNEGHKVATLGPLIHNPQAVADMERRGALVADTVDDIPTGYEVIIRSHGVPRTIYDTLEQRGLVYHDATCPFVKKIQSIAARAEAEGAVLLVAGDAAHPEVQGIVGHTRGEVFVFSDLDELKAWKGPSDPQKPIFAVAQTTFQVTKWQESSEFLKKAYTNARIFDTICNATWARQQEAEDLSQQCDIIVVIGGHHSSNTQKLVQVAAKHTKAVTVETASELRPEWFADVKTAGVTAGASTPSSIIEEVLNSMSAEINDSMSFEEMLNASEEKRVHAGSIVKGIVTSISANEIQVDIGAKQTGFVKLSELTDDSSAKVEDLVKVGDELDLIVEKVMDQDGVIQLSRKKLASRKGMEEIAKAAESGEVVEGDVTEFNKGGVVVNVKGVKVFVPRSQATMRRDEDYTALVGQHVQLVVTECSGRKIVGSINKVTAEQNKAKREEFWANVEVGKTYTGFVKLSELTDDSSAKVEDLVKVGDELDLIVEKVMDQDGVIQLSRKKLASRKGMEEIAKAAESGEVVEGDVTEFNKGGVVVNVKGVKVFVPRSQATMRRDEDYTALVGQHVQLVVTECSGRKIVGSINKVTAEQNKAKREEFWANVEVGKTYTGVVKSLTSYGAFVDIGGVDGLCHISELSWNRIKHPSEVVSVGDTIEVYVKDIDTENHKVSLGYKKAEDNPWEQLKNNYPIGSTFHAPVVSLTKFGAFVRILPGVDGLVHISEISNDRVEKVSDALKVGDMVDVKLLDVDFDKKRISLSMKALLNDDAE